MDTSDLHSMPLWFGYFLILIAGFLIFPATGIMIESHSLEVWNAKVSNLGILFTVGSLTWAFLSWVFLFLILGIGIDIIRKKDKSTPD